jgi:toxin-antitoxin system PIN domain toxin
VFVVDTNVLVYAADEDSPFHSACFDLLETSRAKAAAWYVTWGICYEFLRVTTHSRVFQNPWTAEQAWRFIDALLDAPSIGILTPTERHRDVARGVLKEFPHLRGNLMHDAHAAVLMQEHGIKTIYTRDTDFHRFSFLQPIDPIL